MKKSCIIFLIIYISTALSDSGYPELEYKGSKVEITGQISHWQLIVDGKPFFIKGVGCAVPAREDKLDLYFQLAKEIGANSIRRWGIDSDTKLVLDKAGQYGLMVSQGIWISYGPGFGSNPQFISSQQNNILEIVRKYKDHPTLLLWNIGNENIENLNKDTDKITFCKFLNEICEKIHQIDPNHPVVYTGAMGKSLRLLNQNTPMLDIYGSNAYAGISKFHSEWKSSSIKIPYIFSEYGSDGHWETAKDKYGQPIEPLDQVKAEQFTKRWSDYIRRFDGDCLGGYAFLLEEKHEVTETWWGLTYKGLRRAGYWALYELYTGKPPQNRAPEIRDVYLSHSGEIKRGKTMRIKIDAFDPDRDQIIYKLEAPTDGGAFWIQENEGNKFEYQVPNIPGVYRLYAKLEDNKKNIATASICFRVK